MSDEQIFTELTARYPELESCKEDIFRAARALVRGYRNHGKLLVCGNGGSAADAEHIVGELMKSFEQKRDLDKETQERLRSADPSRGPLLAGKLQPGLPAIALNVHTSLTTAIANDTDANLIFAQQVMVYGSPGDILLGISTSGSTQNVLDALITARALGMTVIGLTGHDGGKMKSFCDILIRVPAHRTAEVQELHRPVYHTLCRITEQIFLRNES